MDNKNKYKPEQEQIASCTFVSNLALTFLAISHEFMSLFTYSWIKLASNETDALTKIKYYFLHQINGVRI